MDSYKRKFYVVFDRKRTHRWWNVFLDDWHYHCFLLTHTTQDGCVEIKVSLGGIRLLHYNQAPEDVALSYLKNGCTEVVECNVDDINTPRIKLARTCVGVCKDFLGIQCSTVITSKQLYNYLEEIYHEQSFWRVAVS